MRGTLLVHLGHHLLRGPGVDSTLNHARGVSSIPGRGTKIVHAACCGQKFKEKKEEAWVMPLNLYLPSPLVPYSHQRGFLISLERA